MASECDATSVEAHPVDHQMSDKGAMWPPLRAPKKPLTDPREPDMAKRETIEPPEVRLMKYYIVDNGERDDEERKRDEQVCEPEKLILTNTRAHWEDESRLMQPAETNVSELEEDEEEEEEEQQSPEAEQARDKDNSEFTRRQSAVSDVSERVGCLTRRMRRGTVVTVPGTDPAEEKEVSDEGEQVGCLTRGMRRGTVVTESGSDPTEEKVVSDETERSTAVAHNLRSSTASARQGSTGKPSDEQ